MENFYLIYNPNDRFKVYLNQSNPDLVKNFNIINRTDALINNFVLVLKAVEINQANTHQWNWEGSTSEGQIYAIKIKNNRFYTLVIKKASGQELFICRHGIKQTNQNGKKLTDTINSISSIKIQKPLQ